MIHFCLKIHFALGLLTQLENLLCLLFLREQFIFQALISNQDSVHVHTVSSNSALHWWLRFLLRLFSRELSPKTYSGEMTACRKQVFRMKGKFYGFTSSASQ